MMREKVITMKKRKKEKHEGHSGRFLIGLIIVTIILVGLLYTLLEIASIKDIVVSGNVQYTKEEIIEMVQIQENSNVIEVFLNQEKDYSKYPYIKEVDIQYNGYDKLHIIVTEKEVINYIKYQDHFLALDKNGIIIAYQKKQKSGIPVVEGLYIKSAVVGNKLDIKGEVLTTLLELHHLKSKYQVPVTHIEFPTNDLKALNLYVNNIKIVLGEATQLDMKMRNAGDVMKKLPSDLAGTLNLEQDGQQFIFKKNTE
ncbi:cell division protein FtsQ/DivIB [Petrocella sp. FN5]|uniref:cell division protein FtsQ/DivIB n=1 Tax=Petrocella sp. FN5 TaxID=3032002 RepID=UPI0023DC4E75|nr:FtsQ-type POTRA domain-containing protein [Petrocella sp. FN5]MDF1616842.1 FtsQ-type POTRA domain-containing protein [Petrocella sp. FN5]